MHDQYKPNFGKVLYGSIVGTADITGKFIKGSLTPLIIPTRVREYKETTRKYGLVPSKPLKNLVNYIKAAPVEAISTVVMPKVASVAAFFYIDDVYQLIGENPGILAIPLATNLLSAGYERFRSNELKSLEEKIKKE